MYQIRGGRGLYTLVNGKWKRIKKTDILLEQQMEVYIKAIHPRRGELSDALISDNYIKHNIKFDQGVGVYILKDSYLSIELAYFGLAKLYIVLFLILFGLYAIDEYTMIFISSDYYQVIFIFFIIFIFPLIFLSITILGMQKYYLEDLNKLQLKFQKIGGIDKIK